MTTYLFVTKPEYKPQSVEKRRNTWSCSKTCRIDDHALIYVTGQGIQYEWRVTSNAKRDEHWPFVCGVEFVRAFDPPISIQEIRGTFPKTDWALPYTSFRGVIARTIGEDVAKRLRGLRADLPYFPDEVIVVSKLTEGAVRQVTINAYERNPMARRQCLAHYGIKCSVCGFDFVAFYGDIGKEFIHVHHLKDLATIGSEYEIDPIADLRPVCPNCHAMLHTKRPAMPIADLKAAIERQKATGLQVQPVVV